MIKYGRKGKYKGNEYLFTHIDTHSHMVYSPDIKSFDDNMYGMWLPSEKIQWIEREDNK